MLLILATPGLSAGPGSTGDDGLKHYADEIEESTRRSITAAESATDMALNALANAIASTDEVEQGIVRDLKSGSREQTETATRQLNDCIDDQDDALELAMKVDLYRRRCSAEADKVRDLIKEAFKASERNDAKSALRKAEKVSRSASKYAGKATVLAEKTKERWLLPQTQSGEMTAGQTP